MDKLRYSNQLEYSVKNYSEILKLEELNLQNPPKRKTGGSTIKKKFTFVKDDEDLAGANN